MITYANMNKTLISFECDKMLNFLLLDTADRIIRFVRGQNDQTEKELLITQPFLNRNTIEIKRVLVTPTRVIMCPVEHWPLSNIFKWIVNNKYMDNLLFISFVTESFEPYPCSKLNANESFFGFILKNIF